MKTRDCRVSIVPRGVSVSVMKGTKLIEAAAKCGITIDTPCGGAGTCGKCKVRITEGAPPASESERAVLGGEETDNGWRLACQVSVSGDMTVHVPESSIFADQHQILSAGTGEKIAVAPAIRKVYIEMSVPSMEDETPDLLRMEAQLGELKTDIELLRRLPGLLRTGGFKGTAVLSGPWLIDFEPGNTSRSAYGVAFDVGTTTLVGSLVDISSGEEKALVSRMNPQIRFGDDLLSRIRHSNSCPDCLEDMREAVIGEIADMTGALCRQASVEPRHVYEAVMAGNTAMQQMLCGIDSRFLGEVPFVPSHGRGILMSARRIGLPISPCGMAYVFPIVGGFVGGDTVAGIVASRIGERETPLLLVDIGTNGEIVLSVGGRILTASTAAGPAFEGARIRCGMRAARGAVEKIVFRDDVEISTIGGAPPRGICGSGLIDLTAELLENGILAEEGRLLSREELPSGVPDALAGRVRDDGEGGIEFLLAPAPDSDADQDIVLTQRDIRELQLGIGAIRAGISILLKRACVRISDLRSVLIAGGFGNFIRRSHAQRIGLLPAGIGHERIIYVGNASLAGAKWALLSADIRREAEKMARKAEHFDLSRDPEFQELFADSMIFPACSSLSGSGRH